MSNVNTDNKQKQTSLQNSTLISDACSTGEPTFPSRCFVYHQVKYKNFYILPQAYCGVFCGSRTNSDYLRIHINRLAFITEVDCAYCAVGTDCLYIIKDNFSL